MSKLKNYDWDIAHLFVLSFIASLLFALLILSYPMEAYPSLLTIELWVLSSTILFVVIGILLAKPIKKK